MIKIYSLPFSADANLDIPASNDPERFIIPINPPMISTRKMISAAAMIPLIGDFKNAAKPCGLESTFL